MGIAAALGNVKSKVRGQPVQKDPILEEINEVLRRLGRNQQYFDMASDDDLLDAIIYEQTSLQKRYTFLLKTARAQGVRVGMKYAEPVKEGASGCLIPYASGDS